MKKSLEQRLDGYCVAVIDWLSGGKVVMKGDPMTMQDADNLQRRLQMCGHKVDVLPPDRIIIREP